MKTKLAEVTGALTYGDVTDETMRLAGEVVLHIVNRYEGDTSFDVTRLNATLWRAEMRCYAELGDVLTGSRYLALAQGPVLDRYAEVLERLVSAGAATCENVGWQQVLRPCRAAVLSTFSEAQVGIVNAVIEENLGKTTSQVSEESRGKAWQIGLNDDTGIAYEAYWISDEPLTSQQRDRVLELKRQFGW